MRGEENKGTWMAGCKDKPRVRVKESARTLRWTATRRIVTQPSSDHNEGPTTKKKKRGIRGKKKIGERDKNLSGQLLSVYFIPASSQ